ncbi:hypothetical protein LX36DRAFT_250020 [Colletotrichum falcatum]|nr:hypothetical protein LX36DRAFT_250020 [Colletotrichum falcatum]
MVTASVEPRMPMRETSLAAVGVPRGGGVRPVFRPGVHAGPSQPAAVLGHVGSSQPGPAARVCGGGGGRTRQNRGTPAHVFGAGSFGGGGSGQQRPGSRRPGWRLPWQPGLMSIWQTPKRRTPTSSVLARATWSRGPSKASTGPAELNIWLRHLHLPG